MNFLQLPLTSSSLGPNFPLKHRLVQNPLSVLPLIQGAAEKRAIINSNTIYLNTVFELIIGFIIARFSAAHISKFHTHTEVS
jgi:hypothetical protein